MVVASAINEEGDQVYPRKWNHDFIDLPEVTDQHMPTFSAEVVQGIVSSAMGQYQMIYSLLARTGMRMGEGSGLEIEKHISKDVSTIKIQQSVWSGSVQTPKTRNAVREIDLPPDLAHMLFEFIGQRTFGFLFQSRNGERLCQTNVLSAACTRFSNP